MHEVLRFEPICQARIWGGRRLESAFGRRLPEAQPIGESWEIVDRPEAQSVVREGTWAGQTLRQVISAHSAEVMGPKWNAERAFPILVKWLDCRERLSLQVHPPAAVAVALQGEPKTENWFVAATAPGSSLLVGLQPGVDRARFERALAQGTVESCVRRIPVSPGDSLLVESGTVHAIEAGCLILEIQQNSDTTYRVFDWGRVGPAGKARALHVTQSLAAILWSAEEPELVRAAPTTAQIADAWEFQIRRVVLGVGQTLIVASAEQPRLLGVVSGGVETRAAGGVRLAAGENVLLPYAGRFEFRATAPTVLLLTENFVGP
jgi:mannose-6-phosphate isomerase